MKFATPVRSAILLLLAGSLAACEGEKPEEKDPVDALQAKNTMSCVSGDEIFSGKGSDVGVGSLGGDGKLLSLSLDLGLERGGKWHNISTGLMTVPMAQGMSYFPDADNEGNSASTYDIRTLDRDLIKQYTTMHYGFAYSDKPIDTAAKVKLQIHRFSKSVAPDTGLPRYHFLGEFTFNTAHMPYVNGNLPEACTLEAIQRAMQVPSDSPARYPQYSAAVCKAEKKRFDCKFDITFDGLPNT